jgi:hypothetical protein
MPERTMFLFIKLLVVLIKNIKEALILILKMSIDEFVNISKVSGILGLTNQVTSYYVDGLAGRPDLSEDLRIKRSVPGVYHSYKFHRDDVDKFVRRVKEYQETQLKIS